MKHSLISILLLTSSLGFSQLPQEYQTKTSTEKMSLLWDHIQSDQWQTLPPLSGAGWDSVAKKLKAFIHLAKTFNHVSDEIPEGRQKIIHTYGVVGKVKLVVKRDLGYTGLFRSGADAVARLSLAADPKANGSFIPGMALKFPITNYPSVNIQVMNNLKGQGANTNWFAEEFTNIIPKATGFALRLVGFFFSLVHSPATNLPLNHLASIDLAGNKVENPVAPFQIKFTPTKESAHLISENSQQDFRTDLAQLKPSLPLYSVWVKDDPESNSHDKEWKYLGDLVLDSPFVASHYGDKVLFFQHHH